MFHSSSVTTLLGTADSDWLTVTRPLCYCDLMHCIDSSATRINISIHDKDWWVIDESLHWILTHILNWALHCAMLLCLALFHISVEEVHELTIYTEHRAEIRNNIEWTNMCHIFPNVSGSSSFVSTELCNSVVNLHHSTDWIVCFLNHSCFQISRRWEEKWMRTELR